MPCQRGQGLEAEYPTNCSSVFWGVCQNTFCFVGWVLGASIRVAREKVRKGAISIPTLRILWCAKLSTIQYCLACCVSSSWCPLKALENASASYTSILCEAFVFLKALRGYQGDQTQQAIQYSMVTSVARRQIVRTSVTSGGPRTNLSPKLRLGESYVRVCL